MDQEGTWLSILDYALVKKTSISTIRRSIKSGRVKVKEESGKYFIWMKESSALKIEKNELSQKLEMEFLKKQNRDLQEEINDLKMLLSVYESDQYKKMTSTQKKQQ